LTGTATIDATVTNGGLVIPGGTGAAGTLTINGSYTQTTTGALDIDIGGTAPGSQYDQLAVSGAASLGGTVDAALINGFQPALGDTFQPLTFAWPTGDFGFYNGIVLGNRLLLDPTLNPTNQTLTVGPAVTTTTLAASPFASVSGQSVTFTASVTSEERQCQLQPGADHRRGGRHRPILVAGVAEHVRIDQLRLQQPVAFRLDGQRGHRRQPARRFGGFNELGLRRGPGCLRRR
jgi:hypothetical protein